MFHYGYYFKHITIAINKYFQRHMQASDLTKPQIDILLEIHQHQDKHITFKELQDVTHLSYPTLTGMIDRLENKGYVKRKECEKDKRVRYIVETEKAQHLHQQIQDIFLKMETCLMANVDPSNQEMLQRCLVQILKNIETEEQSC